MSRARLGLYVFCRRALFEQCYELQPTVQLLLQRPDHLALNLDEATPFTERHVGETGRIHFVQVMGDQYAAYQKPISQPNGALKSSSLEAVENSVRNEDTDIDSGDQERDSHPNGVLKSSSQNAVGDSEKVENLSSGDDGNMLQEDGLAEDKMEE
ncbi:hypothetical protein MA16_Dca008941 [Dendrobium catenatum]|uniref:Uncharacterized protein n=1 Tax=Dendrobium catenatum TaxID=906689 RepID=A0A2I0WRN1_9ASPA|nr:hypothetical protein MA16_Dca008941 [Dendrobium catenatum]